MLHPNVSPLGWRHIRVEAPVLWFEGDGEGIGSILFVDLFECDCARVAFL